MVCTDRAGRQMVAESGVRGAVMESLVNRPLRAAGPVVCDGFTMRGSGGLTSLWVPDAASSLPLHFYPQPQIHTDYGESGSKRHHKTPLNLNDPS